MASTPCGMNDVALFRHDERGIMSEGRITRRSTTDQRRGKTDLDQLRGLTDEEIDAAIKHDADSDPANFDWSDAVLVIPTRKEAISIRLDEDVLAFFKGLGAGYQTRINAVLRHFMAQAKSRQK